MKIVLHACCGPCSTVPLKDYLKQGHDISIFFSNPNIHPESEYIRRRDTIARYASELGVGFAEGEYRVNKWVDAIGDEKAYGEKRCSRCYALRFAETAAYAKEIGADAIATSLTISPYQFTDAINAELARAAKAVSITALQADYRERYRDSVEMSRAAGMYRQNYCGCMYSLVEAQEQRTAARAARKAAKAAGNRANPCDSFAHTQPPEGASGQARRLRPVDSSLPQPFGLSERSRRDEPDACGNPTRARRDEPDACDNSVRACGEGASREEPHEEFPENPARC